MAALGLRNHGPSGKGIAPGTRAQTIHVLHPGPTVPDNPRHLGMYHMALGVPDQVSREALT